MIVIQKLTVTNEVVETVPWHNMKVKAVYDKLNTHEKGLWEKDVVDRLREFGPNKITITERFKILKNRCQSDNSVIYQKAC